MGKAGVCGKVVLDLGVDIKNIHKVLPDTQRFNDIIHCSSTYTSPSIPQYISKTNALIKKNIHLHLSSSELIPDGENADVGIDNSDISSGCDFNLPISLNSIVPNKFHQALHIFKRFSATSWGGLQSQKSIKADNYNTLAAFQHNENEDLNCSTTYSPSNSLTLCSSDRNIYEEIFSLGSFDGSQTAAFG